MMDFLEVVAAITVIVLGTLAALGWAFLPYIILFTVA